MGERETRLVAHGAKELDVVRGKPLAMRFADHLEAAEVSAVELDGKREHVGTRLRARRGDDFVLAALARPFPFGGTR